MKNQESLKVPVQDNKEIQSVFGEADIHLRSIEDEFNVRVQIKSDGLQIVGADLNGVHCAARAFESLLHLTRKGQRIGAGDVRYATRVAKGNSREKSKKILSESIPVFSKRGVIRPKTLGQRRYIESIKKHDLVFGIGPAGTGKTYLAMAMAVAALKSGQLGRIILTRPAVEAGERLGFLPGDLAAKIDPYLRPLYDALHDMMPAESLESYIDRNVVEVAPMAFMRGRTLNNSFVVLDEAQNATIEQMKMFLTRLGFNSKAVITGDVTQTDLPAGKSSGLVNAERVLTDIKGIDFVYFSKEDVVRHELVQRIIEAYEKPDPEDNSTQLEDGSRS